MTVLTEQKKVLIVDDIPENIYILMEILKDQCDLSVAINGKKAIDIATMDPSITLILLDIMMPEMDGYEVFTKLKSNPKTKNIPIIFVTALNDVEHESKGLELGAVDYITKPFNPALIRARVKNHIELKNYRDSLEENVRNKTDELSITQDVMIDTLGTLAEYRHVETGFHINRTKQYIKLLANKLKDHPNYKDYLSDERIEKLYKSAPLHDIGKIGVPDSILLKPGPLTPSEYDEMKKHTLYGRDALAIAASNLGAASFLNLAQEMAYTHHEKWDGSGYPQGLKGEEIPISGRLMAIADAYDALISQRVYKSAFSHEKATNIIRESSGTSFDPEIVKIFLENDEIFYRIAQELSDT